MEIGNLSRKQISRLRNGHAVRVKKGKGHSLKLNDSNLKKCTKCFAKNKGATLKLDPDEVEMNGKGIFSSFKRAVKGTAKNVSKNLAKTMKNKKVQNFATDYAVDVGASALSSNPLVAPLVNRASDKVKKKAKAKGKGVFSKLHQLGKQVQNFGKTPVVADTLNKGLQKGVDVGVDALSAGIVATNPELAPIVAVGNQVLKKETKKQLNKAFSKGNKPKPSESISQVAQSTGKVVAKPLLDYTIQELRKALETKLGIQAQSQGDLDEIEGNGLYYARGKGLNSIRMPDAVQSISHYTTSLNVAPLQKYSI